MNHHIMVLYKTLLSSKLLKVLRQLKSKQGKFKENVLSFIAVSGIVFSYIFPEYK